MIEVLRFLVLLSGVGALLFLAYLLEQAQKKNDQLKKQLDEEREKAQSERERRESAEHRLAAAGRMIDKQKGDIERVSNQNRELEARLNKLWENTARLRKPAGTGPKK
ncbi:MAG: hypothetical protein ACE5HC_04035 [Candidatus Binatia bacterium]